MPLYDYACTKCGRTVEVRHGFDEAHDRPCEVCGAPVRRVFNAAPVLFKGSGFYVTDSRRSSGGKTAEKEKSESPPSEPAKSESAAGPAKSETSSSPAKNDTSTRSAKSEPKASDSAA
jgi:putative FmdB family regulatory protein